MLSNLIVPELDRLPVASKKSGDADETPPGTCTRERVRDKHKQNRGAGMSCIKKHVQKLINYKANLYPLELLRS
jgi:hypothetical protein